MKKKLFLLITMSLSALTALSVLITSGVFANSNKTYADNLSYGISFNSNNNKFHSYSGARDGEATIQTNLGNGVKFSYYGVKSANSSWHALSSGGYFYNIDPIHGIENISISFKTDNVNFSIYYSGGNLFDQHQSFVSSSSEITSFDFNGYNPNYFKVVNEGETGLNISEINITLSCEDDHSVLNGAVPMISEDKKTITYGLYPQTNVDDISLISELDKLTTPESNGWYLYNGEYYANLYSSPYSSKYTFDNGNLILSDTTYWFKCEPITWNVISNTGNELYLLSSVLLDTYRFYDYDWWDGEYSKNNYEHSDIRRWLNDDFYNSAFALNDEYILETNIDNSAVTTDNPTNDFACSNTLDKVFLPSFKDYLKGIYGFSSSTTYFNDYNRSCRTTDWARALGAKCSKEALSMYCGNYWTRSPDDVYYNEVWFVGEYGRISRTPADHKALTVRPAITMKINGISSDIEHNTSEEWKKSHGVIPIIDNETNTITYGLHPQTNVDDELLIAELNKLWLRDSNGYYFYNDEYYAKYTVSLDEIDSSFDNGATILLGSTYWFKCEPITWNILSSDNNKLLLLSSMLLDNHCFNNSARPVRIISGNNIDESNYEYSDIRFWLNDEFYNTAFALNDEFIQETNVDNSDSNSEYACNDTLDKVFLLSSQDYLNSDYGFSSSTKSTDTRICKATDWVKAKGARCSENSLYIGAGSYWTRSHGSNISSDGGFSAVATYNIWYGNVRPAIKIVIE